MVEYLFINDDVLILDSVTFAITDLDLTDSSLISIKTHPQSPCLSFKSSLSLISNEQAELLIKRGVSDLRY